MYQGYFCMGGTEIVNNPRTVGYAKTASQIQNMSVPVPPKEPDRLLATNWIQNPSFEKPGAEVTLFENLFTNPNLIAGASTVEVRRNYARNPRGAASGNYDEYQPRYSWARTTVSGVAVPFPGGPTTAIRVTCPSAQTGAGRGFDIGANMDSATPGTTGVWLNYPVTPGVPVTVSAWARSNRTATGTRMMIRTHDGAGNWVGAANVGTSSTLTGGVWALYTHTITPAAGATYLTARVDIGSVAWAINDTIDQTAVYVGVPGDYFDGTGLQATPDPDLTASWSGAANVSPSILTGVPVAGVTANLGYAIHSVEPGFPLRFIPNGPPGGNNSYFRLDDIPAIARAQGVLIAKSMQKAAITGAIDARGRRLMATSPDQMSAAGTNAAGVTDHRVSFAVTSTYQTRFYHGGGRGSGDLYWSMPGMFAGNYSGPWFSGSIRPHLRENLCKNPNFTANLSGWSGSGGVAPVVSTEWAMFGTTSAKAVATLTNAAAGDVRYGSLTSFPEGIRPGATVTVSAYLNTPSAHINLDTSPGSRQRRMLVFFGGPGGSVTQTFGPQAPNVAGVNRISHTVTVPADATGMIVSIGCAGSSADVPFTSYIDGVLIETSGVLSPYFDGSSVDIADGYMAAWAGAADGSISYVYDPDMTYSWSGTPDASTSLMKATTVNGMTVSGGYTIQSKRWSKYGDYSIRMLGTSFTGAVQPDFVMYPADAGMRAIVTAHLKSAYDGSLAAFYPSLTDGGTNTDRVPNAVGDHDLSITSQAGYAILAGSNVDVWFDGFGLFDPSYHNGYFDGNTVPSAENVDYRWQGDENDSASNMYLISPDPQATYYCSINSFKLNECDTLREALGDSLPYEAQYLQEAPWYSSSTPFMGAPSGAETFLGAYALEVTSLSDSTFTADITEGITDGGIIGRSRRAVPTFRFRLMLIAVDEVGLEYGTTWLNSALSDSICSTHGPSCGSVDLTFFATCPPEILPGESEDEYNQRVDAITRVYHDVKRVNGPVVTEEIRKPKKNIYGRVVEFTLAAGVPSLFGVPSLTGVVPPEGERVISDVAQNLFAYPSAEVADATQVLISRNKSTNPSLETNATGWAATATAISGASPTTYLTSGRTTETAIVGLASFRARILGNSSTAATGVADLVITHSAQGLPSFLPGPQMVPVSLSMWASAGIFAGAAASVINSIRVDAVWLDASSAVLGTLVLGTETTTFTGRVFSAKNVVPPVNADSVRFEVHASVGWSSSSTAANNSDIRLFTDAAALITPL